jgi:sugar lactone lactonase YvrE
VTAENETVEATRARIERHLRHAALGSAALLALASCQMLSGLNELDTAKSHSTGGQATTGGVADAADSGSAGAPDGDMGGNSDAGGRGTGGRTGEPDGSDTGGTEQTGGADTGGTATGGDDTGGTEQTGGGETGGTEETGASAGAGDEETGGEATGGGETGGADTGGSEQTGGADATGGLATGGTGTGGNPLGGRTSAGGRSTGDSGGRATGGIEQTGGVATGGTEAIAGQGGAGIVYDAVLTVDAGADQTALPDQELGAAVVVRLEDRDGAPLVGVSVSMAPPPGAVVSPTTTATDGSGLASFTLRLSRDLGEDVFTVTAPDAAPLAVTATVVAPDDGTIFTSVNTEHTGGGFEPPIAGTAARTGSLWAVEAAADGTLYLADDSRVFELSPAGELEVVAGGGGGDGEYIPATSVAMSPRGLALDENHGLLFISDSNNTVRAVDLAAGTLWTYAGGGDPVYPSVGDGGLAIDALLSGPTHLEVSPDGALYIADTGHNAVRRVDADSGVITPVLSSAGEWKEGVPAFSSCDAACAMIFDSAGRLFVSGYIWTGYRGNAGILRRDPDGTLTHIAGDSSSGASTDDGIDAKAAQFSYSVTALALDSVGNLYLSEGDVDWIRRIDSRTGRIYTVAGRGWEGSTGDYGPATSARLYHAMDLAFGPNGSLAIADTANLSIREVWGLGNQAETPVSLAAAGGDGQSVPVDAAFSAISAHLEIDGTDAAGFTVDFRPVSSGGWASASQATTDASGIASVTGRVGLAVGDHTFEASWRDIHGEHVPGSPVEFTVAATAPDTGTILTIVNTEHASGSFEGPIAGTAARVWSIWAVDAATDGTLYLADDWQVFRLSPAGELTLVAGGGSGDGELVPATDVEIQPRGMALDESNEVLFVSDQRNSTVRAIDLEAETISTYAGGGTPTPPSIGDDGLATDASLSSPYYLRLGPDGALYISDDGHNAVRRVDPASRVITSVVARPSAYEDGVPALYGCGSYSSPCGIAFDESANLFISGYVWTGDGYAHGILRRDPDGTLVHVAGNDSGSTEDGVAATSARFSDTGGIAFDAAGDLWIAGVTGHVVRRIDMSEGLAYTMVGDGAADDRGDYGPSTDARCNRPFDIVSHPDGHMVFADTYNYAVRMIW